MNQPAPRRESPLTQHAASERTPWPCAYDIPEPGHSTRGAPITRLLYSQERRHEIIAQAAYFRARHRGFQPGHELEDWLAAESEVDSELGIGPRL